MMVAAIAAVQMLLVSLDQEKAADRVHAGIGYATQRMKSMRAGEMGYASAATQADFIMVNMVAEAASGSKSPKEAAERAQARAERTENLADLLDLAGKRDHMADLRSGRVLVREVTALLELVEDVRNVAVIADRQRGPVAQAIAVLDQH